MEEVTSTPDPTSYFGQAVAELRSVIARAEVAVSEIRAPQRLAPYSFALGIEVEGAGGEYATGRLILLHDPNRPQSWDGVLRVVAYLRAEIDVEVAADPLLPDVGWSWLTEALDNHGATLTALGGTITRTSSARYGDIAGPVRTDDVEIRASWSPLDTTLRPHGEAFCELLAVAAGLPPVGVAPMARFSQHRA
ncbi:MAG: DUF3000 domain-containing protein [Sciscionella sp.]